MDWKRLLCTLALLHAPEDGTGTGGGSTTTNAGAPPADNSEEAPTTKATDSTSQEEINRIVQQRLERERKKFDEKIESLGFKSFDEIADLKRQQKEREEKELEDQQKYKELLEKTRSEKDAELAKLREQLQKTQSTYRQTTAERQILEAAAAAEAVAPAQVASLLRGNVQVDDEGKSFVVGPGGERMTDGKGNELSVEAYVKTFIEENPHFQRAASGRGAGGSPPGKGGAGPGGFDPSKRNNLKHLQDNREEIIKKLKSGELKA